MSAVRFYYNENKMFGSEISIVDRKSLIQEVYWHTVWYNEAFLQEQHRLQERHVSSWYEIRADAVGATSTMEEFLAVVRSETMEVIGELSVKLSLTATDIHSGITSKAGKMHIDGTIQPVAPSIFCPFIGFYFYRESLDVYITWRLQNSAFSL